MTFLYHKAVMNPPNVKYFAKEGSPGLILYSTPLKSFRLYLARMLLFGTKSKAKLISLPEKIWLRKFADTISTFRHCSDVTPGCLIFCSIDWRSKLVSDVTVALGIHPLKSERKSGGRNISWGIPIAIAETVFAVCASCLLICEALNSMSLTERILRGCNTVWDLMGLRLLSTDNELRGV